MIDYYPISGCYVLRPWSYRIWENIQHYLEYVDMRDAFILTQWTFQDIGCRELLFPYVCNKGGSH